MPRDVTGLEYAAGVRAPVPGQENYVTVVDSTGYNYVYRPASEVLPPAVDETYTDALAPLLEGVRIKEESGALVYVARVRALEIEEYFLFGWSDPITTTVGQHRWTVQGTAPTIAYSSDPVGVELQYTAQFALTLCESYSTPLVDTQAFDKVSFIHKAGGEFFLGLADDSVSAGSETNAVGFKSTGVGNPITVYQKSVEGGTSEVSTGVLQSAAPQAFRIERTDGSGGLAFYIDGVAVDSGAFTSSNLLGPQMNYSTATSSVVPMYFTLQQTLGGAALLDGNID